MTLSDCVRASRWGVIALTALSLGAPLEAQEAAKPLVVPLPALARAESWTVETNAAAYLKLGAAAPAICVRFDGEPDRVGDVRLREPVPIPADADNLTFLGNNNSIPSSIRLQAIIRDATGQEFLYYTLAARHDPKSAVDGQYLAGHYRARELRFSVPGLKRPVLEGRSSPTILPPRPALEPRPPLMLAGLRLIGNSDRSRGLAFYFKDFAFTRLTPDTSACYYHFDDQELFGELDPLPYVTPGHLRWYGKRFEISWDARSDFAGQPFLAGGRTYRFPNVDDFARTNGMPFALQLADPVNIPITEKGTYWVRVRYRWSKDDRDSMPDTLEEREYRLFVYRGAEPHRRVPLTAAAAISNSTIRIAPDRKSLIFAPRERFAVRVAFWKPPVDVTNTSFQIVARTASDGVVMKTLDVTPVWSGAEPYYAELDLSGLPAGAYRIRATVRSGERIFDELDRLVGRQGAPPPFVFADRGPIPSHQELLARPRPLFHLSPRVQAEPGTDNLRIWEEQWRPFLDGAGALSTDIELQIPWQEVEPLPGVYDWRQVDRFVNHAHGKGLSVLLWPEIRAGSVPEWLPSLYERSYRGDFFGSDAYLFHGCRPNYAQAAPIRDGLQQFIRALAERYREHPGVQGYFFCFEGPGDSPYRDWYEGYGDETLAAFRAHCRATWRRLGTLNKRWGTTYRSWADVGPPRDNPARACPTGLAQRHWLDWMLFKSDGIDGFLKGMVRAVRDVDTRRLVVVYGDGMHDFAWFRDQGCMAANGGSHDANHMPGYAQTALSGLPERTEDHSPGNWTAYFPSQPDASIFAMMAGGGPNAHAKAYVDAHRHFADMADPNASLGRYRRLLPIWAELHATAIPDIGTYLLEERSSYLAAARTTYCGWWGDGWANTSLRYGQVPCSRAPAESWDKCKLLVIARAAGMLDEATLARVARYVEAGGTVFMMADAGRTCVDRPDEDWVLLRRFGFTPPPGPIIPDRYTTILPLTGTVFQATARPFTIRDTWAVPLPAGADTIAVVQGEPGRAAISWKPVGKGRVAVLWAQTIVPPIVAAEGGVNYPFLRDIARWAGVRLDAESTDYRFWTNFLCVPDGSAYYGLVFVHQAAAAEGTVRWLTVPDGRYRVTELLSGTELGERTGAQLRTEGLRTKLRMLEAAVYRMKRVE